MRECGVLVRGGGIAAGCCARLLQSQGCLVASDKIGGGTRAALPAILVSSSTQKLLADLFQSGDLFAGLPSIRKRVVAWGAEPVALPHLAVVAPEGALLERLRRLIEPERTGVIGDSKWTIDTARAPEPTEEMHFGSRMASVTEVKLAEDAEGDACWVEAVAEGWLFLLSTGDGGGSLIGVGAAVEALLAESRLVGRQIRRLCGGLGEFAAYPRTAAALCGPGWLACGSAAMTFDPLCGEGAGNAAREAILACAAVRAIAGAESEEDVLAEYSLRLRLGFLRHLENCRQFYRRDVDSAFWTAELERIERGIAWTQEELRGLGRPKFRLVGFDLERNAGEEIR